MALLAALSFLLAVATLIAATYLGLLAVLARPEPAVLAGKPGLFFAIVVPAHDEEDQIAQTVRNLRTLGYPRELFDVFVVADNCSDRTAERALAAGARVIERRDPSRRGKGYALEEAFQRLLAATRADAFVVVDADTVVTPNLLVAFAARLEAGAHAVQAEYGVRNVGASWRTRLMTVALAMFHRTRSLGRARLGLSTGLRGNGMCFSRELLSAQPHRSFGLVEDVEYGVQIGLAGYRVFYAGEACVFGEMVSRGHAAVSQRRRWELGRLELARRMLPALAREAIRRKSPMLADLALDLAIPPLSYVLLAAGAGLAFELGRGVHSGELSLTFYLWGVSWVALALYAARGIQHSGLGLGGIAAIAYAPVYMLWKIVANNPLRRPDSWVRTGREAHAVGSRRTPKATAVEPQLPPEPEPEPSPGPKPKPSPELHTPHTPP